ncbi:SH3 domain-containing protein [Azospirillum sp. sgz302134]
MTRRLRLLPLSLAVGCAVLVTACETRDRIPRPPVVQTAPPAAGPGLDPMYGDWETDKGAQMRSQPSNSAPLVASYGPGQPVKVLGRARGTDWVAVQAGGSTAYIRMHLLRLRGTAPQTVKGTTTTVAKPTDNAGPSIKAAPRRKIEATPIGN